MPHARHIVYVIEWCLADECKAMLDEDERENAETQKFMQEEEMDASLAHTGSSLGLPDSWSLHSHVQLSEQPSFMSCDDDQAFTRISIGTFMGSKTEVLGSLDGDRATPRVSAACVEMYMYSSIY